ncbi:MAG: hypothetical protein ACLQGT_01220 [Terracidiphilus sp.]
MKRLCYRFSLTILAEATTRGGIPGAVAIREIAVTLALVIPATAVTRVTVGILATAATRAMVEIQAMVETLAATGPTTERVV